MLFSPINMVGSREATPVPQTFTQELLSQDNMEAIQPFADVTKEQNRPDTIQKKKPVKKTRLLLDARTELTDEELKVSSSLVSRNHIHGQCRLLVHNIFVGRSS